MNEKVLKEITWKGGLNHFQFEFTKWKDTIDAWEMVKESICE